MVQSQSSVKGFLTRQKFIINSLLASITIEIKSGFYMNILSDSLAKQIQDNSKNTIFYSNVPWSELTTIGIGSYAKLVAEPSDDVALSELLKFCHKEEIPVFPIGSGSNIVGTDSPYDGIIIKLKANDFSNIKFGNGHATVGAGATMYELAVKCADYGFGGFAKLAGIPGTIGGSIRTNAGRLGMSISDIAVDIVGFTLDGEPWISQGKDIKWFYRHSSVPLNVIITAMIVKLEKIEKSAELSLISEYLSARSKFYPKERNAGCIFKNPASGHTAGKLIDISGCKSMTKGGAKVSDVHANFILNTGRATEKDFLALALEIKSKVVDKTGIYLSPEVIFVDDANREKLNSEPKPLNVLLLKGGNSHERPVSLESAEGVSKALKEAGYNVREYDITEPVITDKMANGIDVVFPVMHGGFGENGQLQNALESKGLRFVGSGSQASQIIIDKIKTKKIFVDNDIPTAKYEILKAGDKEFPSSLRLPVVVKAPNEGSTFGVSIVSDMSEWDTALRNASGDISGLVLVEEFIQGYELTVGILNGMVLPIVHIQPPCEFYDFDAKYTHQQGETIYTTPPDAKLIPENVQKEIQEYALKAYHATGARDMSRVDAILCKKTMKPYFLELNSIPGFTSSSLLPKAAAAVDIPYIQLCGILVQLASRR